MKKLFTLLLCLTLLSPGISYATSKVENQNLDPNAYHAEWHSQSSYSTLKPLEITTVWVKFKNTGSTSWYNYGDHPVRLGTSHNLDRVSPFYKHTWISENRAAKLIETEVKPEHYGTFEFYLKAPDQSGIYKEYFQPVVEGITWMEDWGVYWEITVEGGTESKNDSNNNLQYDSQDGYHAAFQAQSSEHIILEPGEYQTVWVEFLNTGSQTWYNYGNNPVHLGTDSPRDRNSGFYKHTWIASNRPAKLQEKEVFPGQIGTFEFYVLAPNEPGEHYEYFTPVVENLTWIGHDGVYWIFEVNGNQDDNKDNNQVIDNNSDFNLTGSVANGKVTLNWDKYIATTQTSATSNQISGYKVVRSETKANPVYPDDWWVYLANQNTTSYTDSSVQVGHSYYYRVGAYKSGTGVIEYSNNIFLTIATDNNQNNSNQNNNTINSNINLSASANNSGIQLRWNQYPDSSISGYKIVRSTSNSNPTYPDNYLKYVSGVENVSALDLSVLPGQNYYYRIGIYKNDSIIEYSDSVQVEYTGTN